MMIPEMRYPEMTKKTSTPMKPPGINSGKPWKIKTIPMAMVLSPSISARYYEWTGFSSLVLTIVSLIC